MNNKIGIVTVTYMDNFGSHLQSFAMQEAIRLLGYETEIIDINSVKKEVANARKKYFVSRCLNTNEIKSYFPAVRSLVAKKIDKKYKITEFERAQMYSEFANKSFAFSPKVNSWKGLYELCQKYHAVVVGSDQNWRPANIAGDFYTLSFVPEEINKIAYATSFGLPQIRKNQIEKAAKFLKRINHLSIRETSGQRLVQNITGRNIPVVCDPTYLLDRIQWENYIENEQLINGDYILCYFLGENIEHRKFVVKLREKTGIKVVAILNGAGYVKEKISYADIAPNKIGPLEFLNLVKNSKYICTDSFHGCAFATLFERQFFAFHRFSEKDGMSTNDRLHTMFNWAGITNRIKSGNEEIIDVLSEKINYIAVNENIVSMRKRSFEYLSSSLANSKNTDI